MIQTVNAFDEQLAQLRQKVKDNLRSDENENGVLANSEAEYLSCFEMKKKELADLLE